MSRIWGAARLSETAGKLLAFCSLALASVAGAQVPPRDAISDSVGATFGEFRVDDSGNANYSMPIFAPPGTAGVAPKLTLVYNSQSGMGPAGKSFSIGGLSAISRCRKTREHGDFFAGGVPVDGNSKPIAATNEDAFCLDGQRLILTTGVYGADGAEYRLETDPFTRITSIGGDNSAVLANYSGPLYFRVQRKDGSTSFYGNSTDSRIEACGDQYHVCASPAISVWAMNRFQDSTGNFIDYVYLENPSSFGPRGIEFQISQVLFTGKVQLPGQSQAGSAAYAGIYFSYFSITNDETETGYQGGYGMRLSQRLSHIDVRDQLETVPRTLRHYRLQYTTSASGSNVKLLRSILECRENPDINPATPCYRPTTFTWSDAEGVGYSFDTQDNVANPGETRELKSSRLGDVDGDGRTDLVWFRGSDVGCPAANRLMVSFSERREVAGNSILAFDTRSTSYCSQLTDGDGELDTGWGLSDFNGDGRADLWVADDNSIPGARWHVFPSLGKSLGSVVFDMGNDLLPAGDPIPTANDSEEQAQLGDFNGDGLVEILYPTSPSGMALRFLQRKTIGTGFELSAPRTINFEFQENECDVVVINGQTTTCNVQLFNQDSPAFGTGSDLNGDGRADLVLRVTRSTNNQPESIPPVTFFSATELAEHRATQVIGAGVDVIYVFVMDTATATTQTVKQYGEYLAVDNGITQIDPRAFSFSDFNGDGLADALFQLNPATNHYVFALNSGRSFTELTPVGNNGTTGTITNIRNKKYLQLADLNGDGRTELIYPGDITCPGAPFESNGFRYRRFQTQDGNYGNFGGFDRPASSDPEAEAVCVPGSGDAEGTINNWDYFFADFDGDGATDFVRMRDSNDDVATLYTSRASVSDRFKAKDVVTRITNGHGAVTNITYQPLTNKAIYRRARNAPTTKIFGRGSVVQDLLGPLYVVSQVSSSAPTLANPAAQSSVWYRYAGALVQGGGRGFLGFLEISTFDANATNGAYVATGNFYLQDFPFTGSPVQTEKRLRPGTPTRGTPELDACALNPEAAGQSCFYNLDNALELDHPPLGGNLVHAAAQLWGCQGNGGADACAFAQQLACETAPFVAMAMPYVRTGFGGAQQPLFPYVARTLDVELDPIGGAVTSHVCGTFQYADAFGNATQTELVTFSNASVDPAAEVLRKTTINVYANDSINWRLGRLLTSEIRDKRGATTQSRFTDFDYEVDRPGYSSPVDTGFLKAERLQKDITSDQDLRTLYTLDDYGNRTASFQCSRLDPVDGSALTDAECRDKLRVQQRPVAGSGTTAAVHRYSLLVFDSLGRYLTETRAPYFSPTATNNINEQASQTVQSRDEFGNPTQATDANGLTTTALVGGLGRPYYAADTTGKSVTTTYRWCGVGLNEASCPLNASFRQQVVAAGAPTVWRYYDLLGREVLSVSQSFNTDIAGKNWSAICTGFDAHARTEFTSIPFFLSAAHGTGAAPVFSGNPCFVGMSGGVVLYDALARTIQTQASDGTQVTTSYSGLTTTVRNVALGQEARQTKNALGEVITITQADPITGNATGMAVQNEYDAQGNLRFVRRNAGQGEIVTEMRYDALGRTIEQIDPDAGSWTYQYSAAGEQVRQTDAKGQATASLYDALGRLWLRRTGAGGEVGPADRIFANGFETTSGITLLTDRWEFDTAERHDAFGQVGIALGALAMEERTQATAATYRRVYTYDPIGRLSRRDTLIDGQTYIETTSYDSVGRPGTQTDASGQTLTTGYSPRGYLQTLTDTSAGLIYQVLEQNARGQTTEERRGNSAALETSKTYEPLRGWLDTIRSGSGNAIQDWNFDFNTIGNLTRRQRGASLREDFVYDQLNRLTQVTLTAGVTVVSSQSYDALGNLCTKSGQVYLYAGRDGCNANGMSGSPHAVTQVGSTLFTYDPNGNQTTADAPGTVSDRFIGYDAQNQAIDIALGSTVTPSARTTFRYGPDRSRYKRQDDASGSVRTTLYIGNVERITRPDGVIETKRYLGGVLIETRFSNNPTPQKRYVLGDHLGSLDVLTDENGVVQERLSFEAFGARRDAGDWQDPPPVLPAATTHGFTGHEHVDGLNVIHMNGRIYDPILGRFLQSDPMVDAGTQGLNRYSYVLNNPLSATDPTGNLSTHEWGQIFMAAILIAGTGGAGLTVAEGFFVAGANGFMAGAVQSGTVKGGAWGAFSAMAFYGIGTYFDKAAWAQADGGAGVFGTDLNTGGYAAKVLAHGTMGGVVQHLQGGKFGSGFAAAGVTTALSGSLDPSNPGFSTRNVFVAALVGGTASKLTGNKFATGAVTAAFSYAFGEMGSSQGKGGSRIGAGGGGGGGNGPRTRVLAMGEMAADGFGPPAPYKGWWDAVQAGLTLANGSPNAADWEYGGAILTTDTGFFITQPVTVQSNEGFKFSGIDGAPEGARLWGLYHNHPNAGPAPMYFSPDDVQSANKFNAASFISVPGGGVRMFDGYWMQGQRVRINAREYVDGAHRGVDVCTSCLR